ncbi:MAG: hypothetical protein CME62_13045 [Halobacteriovoraceae bacterium]|nr:hypothetical protein [Halobacteriovoraceae bacterium]|tara:strand:+ start:402 stop:1109 length:708 start_codon:yes stop_codon:yes gene_type:complete
MLCFRFSFFILIYSVLSLADASTFTSNECKEAKFQTEIVNSGSFFGLLKNDLSIKKDGCLFEIKFLKLKWLLDKTWKVDICREPIHLKVSDKGSESFYKRVEECQGERKDNQRFCVYWGELKENLENYGLIYAQGARENLKSAHGQTYCTYLLLEKYLDEGVLFSKFKKANNIFSTKPKTKEQSPVRESSHQDLSSPHKMEVKSEEKAESSKLDVSEEEGTQEADQKEDESRPKF